MARNGLEIFLARPPGSVRGYLRAALRCVVAGGGLLTAVHAVLTNECKRLFEGVDHEHPLLFVHPSSEDDRGQAEFSFAMMQQRFLTSRRVDLVLTSQRLAQLRRGQGLAMDTVAPDCHV